MLGGDYHDYVYLWHGQFLNRHGVYVGQAAESLLENYLDICHANCANRKSSFIA